MMDAFGCRSGLKIVPNRRTRFQIRSAIIISNENIQASEISRLAPSLHVRLRKYAMKGLVSDLGDEAFISILPMLSRVWAKIPFASATEIFSISTKKLQQKTPTKHRCGFIRRCITPGVDCGWITI